MCDDTVPIGEASSFWGDSMTGPLQLAAFGRLDFLVFDYLAELTMLLLASVRMGGVELGYAIDFMSVAMHTVLKGTLVQSIRIITNVGGMNSRGCAAALQALTAELGVSARIAVVEDDGVMALLSALRSEGVRELQSARPLPDKVVSANVYLGASPIKAVFDAGTWVVITGYCVDGVVTLGASMHVFEWHADDHGWFAAGSLARHILECDCQGTDGLHTDWEAVPDQTHSGYPIAECRTDDSFIITKSDGTGGLVTTAIVDEQLLYGIGDPVRYASPNVVYDFTHVTMMLAGEHRVEAHGTRGCAPTPDYKVSATYVDGRRATGQLTTVGIDVDRKARHTAGVILGRMHGLFRQLGLPNYSVTHIETLGLTCLPGPHQPDVPRLESVMRLVVTHLSKQALDPFVCEIAPAGTSWTLGTTDAGGRPNAVPAIKQHASLVGKVRVQARVALLGEEGFDAAVPTGDAVPEPSAAAQGSFALPPGPAHEVSLIELAYARSGDKGGTSNIGIIACRPEDPPLLYAQLTEDAIAAYLAHVVRGCVTRYGLPGIRTLNFVCEQASGGGDMVSLRNDPPGEGMTQVLLAMPVRVPVSHP